MSWNREGFAPKYSKTVLHLSMGYIWVHEKFFLSMHDIWFETCSSELELGNTAQLLVAGTVAVTMPQTPKDMNPAITIYTYSVLWKVCNSQFSSNLIFTESLGNLNFTNKTVPFTLIWDQLNEIIILIELHRTTSCSTCQKQW